ncbi:hypothetical protein Tco_1346585 [Tanacetum coccineum]
MTKAQDQGSQSMKEQADVSFSPKTQYHNNETSSSTLVPQVIPSVNMTQELEILFSPMFDEYFNEGTQGVSKSFTISDNQQHDTSPQLNVQPTSTPSIPRVTINAEEITTIKQ